MTMNKLGRWMVLLPAVGLLAACNIPGVSSHPAAASSSSGGAYRATPMPSVTPPSSKAMPDPMPSVTPPSPDAMPRVIHIAAGQVVDDIHITTLHCHGTGTTEVTVLPDSMCTPGAVDPAVTQATIKTTICVTGYTQKVRPSASATNTYKRKIMIAYGMDPKQAAGYELDHLVPLELGGSSATSNLWPELGPVPNPKDTVEGQLHKAVCAGKMTLVQAQQEIAANWTTAR